MFPKSDVLIELARFARRAESASELQFLLSNQTRQIISYRLLTLWIEGEGTIAVSGVSELDSNSPFITWLNQFIEELSEIDTPKKISPNQVSNYLSREWDQWLPKEVLLIPLGMVRDELKGFILLGLDHDLNENDSVVLNEWIDIWRHAWIKFYAPSALSQIRAWTDILKSHLPSKEKLKQDWHYLILGFESTILPHLKSPRGIFYLIQQVLRSAFSIAKDSIRFLKKNRFLGSIELFLVEVQKIYLDKSRRIKWLIIVIFLFPVRLSVLVPGELVAANPSVMRSPIDGVIGQIFVQPNQVVTEGQPLFSLDLTTLENKLRIAQQELGVASAEFRSSSIQSLSDSKSRSQLGPQEGKIAEKRLEVEYLQDMLARSQLLAPKDGVVIFDDPSEWIGKPVVAGEKVMIVVADKQVEIEAWLPMNDAIELPKNSPVTLYLNASPLSPVRGELKYAGHEILKRPDGSYAYRVRAIVPDTDPPRVGLKGTAKVNGPYVPVYYWLLRKPLGYVRQFLGI